MRIRTSRFLVWLVVPLTFAVYLFTLSPTVGLIDSGELAAGCRLLNILHATGYPLYTMLGRLASLVPLATVASRMAVLSALFATGGVALFLLLGLRLGVSPAVAGASALLVAFSLPLWHVAVDVEVYSLTFGLVVLLWLVAESVARSEMGCGHSGRAERGPDWAPGDRMASGARNPAVGGALLILAYLAGLTLTNHLTATSAVLGVALAVILSYRLELVRRLPVLVLLFLLGLTPYIFLILRARAGPLFAWGNPYNLQRFYWTVTGREFQVWMFSLPFREVMHNAGRGAALLARSFVYLLVPVVFYGAVRLFRQSRPLAIGLAVSAVFAFAYAINYSISDIEPYYLTCLVALAVFGMVGLDGLMSNLEYRISSVGRTAVIVVRQVPWFAGIAALAMNLNVASRQGDFVAHDMAMNMLASAGQNATIITDWRDLSGAVFYLQHVEHVRPDVCWIDKELLRTPWYLDYLGRDYPWLAERSRAEIEAYRPYLDQYERGRLKEPVEIERRYIALLESFITRSPDRPAYMTFDVDAPDPEARLMFVGEPRAPVGVLFQIRHDSILPEFDYTRLVVRLPRHEPDSLTRDVLVRYRFFVMRRARALAASGRRDEIQALIGWYRSQAVSRVAPLPAR